MLRKRASGDASINVKASALIPSLILSQQIVREPDKLKEQFIHCFRDKVSRLNNSVFLFFLKVCSLARQREKVEPITIKDGGKFKMSKYFLFTK